jgi:hypothetical protein
MDRHDTMMTQNAVASVARSVVNISPQKAEIERCFEILRWFVQAQVRKQVLLDLWSWQGNIPFYIHGKILVIQERARFHTFLCLVSHVTNKCASADDLLYTHVCFTSSVQGSYNVVSVISLSYR